jgi:hypothetical protein
MIISSQIKTKRMKIPRWTKPRKKEIQAKMIPNTRMESTAFQFTIVRVVDVSKINAKQS